MILVSICALIILTLYRCRNNIDDAIPLPGHNYYCSKNKLYATQCYSDVLTITTPLGKLHRHVVDVLTVYPYHSVNSIGT